MQARTTASIDARRGKPPSTHAGPSGHGASEPIRCSRLAFSQNSATFRDHALTRAIEAELLVTLAGQNRLFRAQEPRVDALPGNLAREATEFDLRAAVHDHLYAPRLGSPGCGIVADGELHPDHFGEWDERQGLVGDRPGGFRIAEDLHHIEWVR